MGAFVAFLVLRFQENTQAERDKLEICNKWTIEIEGLFQSLIAFKGNYISEVIVGDPITRAIKVRTIIGNSEQLQLNYAELSFISPRGSDSESQIIDWRQISRIRGMVENYNMILSLWAQRNKIERPLRELLIQSHSTKPYADLTHEEVIQCIGLTQLASLIDLTEKAIHLTDDLIIESNDFLASFPEIVKQAVDTKRIKAYGTVLRFYTKGNPYLQEMIVRIPEVDFNKIAEIFGVTVSEAESFYNHGYPA